MKPTGSLFISTYEMPRHLALVLAAVERQTTRDFEIFICDDGSTQETKDLVEAYSRRSPVPIRYIWQPHQGFRKCRVLNQAVQQAKGSIFIFLDGDCIPHRDYVKDHLENQEEGRYLAGRRVELGPMISNALTVEQVAAGYFDWPKPSLVWSALRHDTEFLNRSLRIPSLLFRQAFKMGHVVDMKGCNYSIPRNALEAINGFDEEYEGYGREDTDVEIRLQNLGYKIKSMKGLAIQFHVWHPRREFTPQNDERLELLKRSRRIRAVKGLES
jgi:glycosyltransferase involved in cell wall biosynthesis